MRSNELSFGIILVVLLGFSAMLFNSCKKKNVPPTCLITNPIDGEEIEEGEDLVISVDASDEDGEISEVIFYVDNIGVFSSSSSPYTYTWNTKGKSAWSYTIKATAIDDDQAEKSTEVDIVITMNVSIPVVTTSSFSGITNASAIGGGDVTNEGRVRVTVRGVCWGTSSNPTISDNTTRDGQGVGLFTSQIFGLTDNTTYYVRAYATNSEGTAYGSEKSFTTSTLTCPNNVSDVEGNIYNVVKIGSQCWMAENQVTTKYNDSTDIPLITDDNAWTNSTTPGYCWYDNDEAANKPKYGALYNWHTIETGKLCPTGWHIPSYDEWADLVSHLGGADIAGGKMKATSGWDGDNGTNESGFSALPGGSRYFFGYFNSIGDNGKWWSASEYNSLTAWGMELCGANYSSRMYREKAYGLSVRCVQGD